jgi:hypothetical protein
MSVSVFLDITELLDCDVITSDNELCQDDVTETLCLNPGFM